MITIEIDVEAPWSEWRKLFRRIERAAEAAERGEFVPKKKEPKGTLWGGPFGSMLRNWEGNGGTD